MKRIEEIEDESATGVVVVGEEHGALGHCVFSVVNAESAPVGCEYVGAEWDRSSKKRRRGADDSRKSWPFRARSAAQTK